MKVILDSFCSLTFKPLRVKSVTSLSLQMEESTPAGLQFWLTHVWMCLRLCVRLQTCRSHLCVWPSACVLMSCACESWVWKMYNYLSMCSCQVVEGTVLSECCRWAHACTHTGRGKRKNVQTWFSWRETTVLIQYFEMLSNCCLIKQIS